MNNSKKISVLIVFFTLALLSVSGVAQAQYQTQQTTNFVASSTGVTHVVQIDTGVSADIILETGATGSLSTALATQNLQPQATPPSGQIFGLFITVGISVSDTNAFHGATLTIHYTDADVQGMTQPYKLYKYVNGNFVEWTATFDTTAKTVTFSMETPTDPLFAVGGTSETRPPETPTWIWITIVVVVVAVIFLAFAVLSRRKPQIQAIKI